MVKTLNRWIAIILAGFVRLISGVQVKWKCSPLSQKQRIYFANHSSHLDFIVLWSCFSEEARAKIRPVAAKDYWKKGIRYYLASQIFNAILIHRNAKYSPQENPVDYILSEINNQYSLVFFPEGTRSKTGEIAPFKSGLFHLANLRKEIELIPVYLDNLNRILPKGQFIFIPLMSRITFGAPLQLELNESKDEFLTRAHEAIIGLKSI